MRLLLLPFLFLALAGWSTPVDSLVTEEWFEQALVHYDNGEPDSFELMYEKVAIALEKQDDLKGWIVKHKNLGKKALLDGNDANASMSFLEKAFEENLFRAPVSEEEWEELGYLYIFTGYVQNNEFEAFDEARNAYRKAEKILVEKLGINDFYVARFLYLPLSTIYTMKGDYTAAETVLKKCYQICMAEGELDYAASVLSDLSVVYLDVGDLKKAEGTCQKGLEMDIRDEVSLALLNSNMAKTLFFQDRLKEGLPFALAANRFFQILIDQGWAEVAMGWLAVNKSLVGEIYTAMEDFRMADLNFGEAELLLTNIYQHKYDRDFGKLYQTWGRSKLASNDPESALEYFQQSLKSMLPSYRAENPLQNPDVRSLYGENTLMDALEGKAIALNKMFDGYSDVAYLKTALDCHESIFEVEHQLRQTYFYDDSKLYNVEDSRKRVGHAIDVCMKLFGETQDQQYYEVAFALAEKSKSVLLLEAFLKNNSPGKGLPQELFEEEKTLQGAIVEQEKLLHDLEAGNPGDSVAVQEAREMLLTKKMQFADWQNGIRQDYGHYYNNRFNDKPVAIRDVRETTLAKNETLLEYFVSDSKIYLFVINSGDFEVFTSARPENFKEDVLALQKSIQGYFNTNDPEASCEQYTSQAISFYNLLLKAPVEAGLVKENVLVIPSGLLALIPFDVLLTGEPESPCQFNEYPYALLEYNFSYGYSATLHYQLAGLPSRSPGSFMGVAPEFEGNNGWGALKANVELLKELEKEWEGIYALNDSATIANMKKALENQSFEILHFSTHAEANTGKADFSFVIFADGTGNYDSLFVKDIYQLRLLSEMVVLGACETASGSLYDGEGVISLARAFLQVGSRSVITTMWSVYDGTNKSVMLDFYQNLQEGMPKGKALQQAKINQTRLDARSAHPVFWAAYVPYGQMDPIRNGNSQGLYGLILFLAIVGILGIWRWRKPKKDKKKG
ncbi:MAG: CHAT domain-containing protein [Bacteroidetes bacterium]|nr:MAG: CHAT domain-containing protein [Bacteroidota bacterium]